MLNMRWHKAFAKYVLNKLEPNLDLLIYHHLSADRLPELCDRGHAAEERRAQGQDGALRGGRHRRHRRRCRHGM